MKGGKPQGFPFLSGPNTLGPTRNGNIKGEASGLPLFLSGPNALALLEMER